MTKILNNSYAVSNLYLSPNNLNRLYIILNNKKILVSNNALAENPSYDTLLIPSFTSIAASIVELKGKENELSA